MILMLVHPTFKVEIDQPITHLEYLSIKESLEKLFGIQKTSNFTGNASVNNFMNQFFNNNSNLQQQPDTTATPANQPTNTNTVTFNTLNRFQIIIKAEIKANDLY